MNCTGFPNVRCTNLSPVTVFCFQPVTVKDAFRKLEILAKRYPPESKTVSVTSLEPGRTLAEDVEIGEDVPAVRTSSVDGFATFANQLGTKRRIVGLSTAVTPYNAKLQLGECVRITNGGAVPDGADTVVPLENVALISGNAEEKMINVQKELIKGENIREKGSEARSGDTVLKDGHRLDSISIGLLIALGCSRVEIYKVPRVCVLTIENQNNQDKLSGALNRSQLLNLFRIHGFKAIDVGTSSNRVCEIEKNLHVAAKYSCIIVITGGDGQIRKTIQKLKLKFEVETISSNPGNFSFAYGSIEEKPVLLCMLPQDPRSAWIGANLFITPILRTMEGRAMRDNSNWKAQLTKSISRSSNTVLIRARSEFLNGRLYTTPVASDIIFGANSILEIKANSILSAGDFIDVSVVEPL